MIKIVSFDVGGTLIDHSYFNYVWDQVIPRRYAEREGLSFQTAKAYVMNEYEQLSINDIRWYRPEYWFQRFHLPGDPVEIFKEHTDKIRFYPEVPAVRR